MCVGREQEECVCVWVKGRRGVHMCVGKGQEEGMFVAHIVWVEGTVAR